MIDLSAPVTVCAQARDLGLRNTKGCPFAGVTLTVHKGELLALRGQNGSGKTALLLTLAGRMVANQGTLTLLGHSMPKERRKIQKRIGLGEIKGLNDMGDNLSVIYAVGAEFELYGKRPKADTVHAYMQKWDLEDVARLQIKDLSEEMRIRVGIALGMVNDPDMLCVDNVEDQLTSVQSMRLMEFLGQIAHEHNMAVIVACTDRELAAQADAIYHVG